MTVSIGSEICFYCTVISSQETSRITWKLGETIIDERIMDRFDVSHFVNRVDEGIKTTSILSIVNVTGYDSNVVECLLQHPLDAATVARQDAVLSVLGKRIIQKIIFKAKGSITNEVELYTPISFWNGVIVPIQPKTSLLLPVEIRLFLTNVETGENMSLNTFHDSTPVNLVVHYEQIPYTTFTMGVQPCYEGLEGPMVK